MDVPRKLEGLVAKTCHVPLEFKKEGSLGLLIFLCFMLKHAADQNYHVRFIWQWEDQSTRYTLKERILFRERL